MNGHENRYQSDRQGCKACHGANLEGTALSRTVADRTFSVEEAGTVRIAKGTKVSCALCHGRPGLGSARRRSPGAAWPASGEHIETFLVEVMVDGPHLLRVEVPDHDEGDRIDQAGRTSAFEIDLHGAIVQVLVHPDHLEER